MINHVETTTAPVADRTTLADVHAALKDENFQPERYPVDAGCIDANALVDSAHDHGMTLVGPLLDDNKWQARTEGAFPIEQFDLDWDYQIATCRRARQPRAGSRTPTAGATTSASGSP